MNCTEITGTPSTLKVSVGRFNKKFFFHGRFKVREEEIKILGGADEPEIKIFARNLRDQTTMRILIAADPIPQNAYEKANNINIRSYRFREIKN